MPKAEEKRRFVRLNHLVDVVYQRRPSSGKLSLAKNISKGGICLIAYDELKEQDTLDLKIYLPEDNVPINALGRVVWAKEFIVGDVSQGKRLDVGIEFIKISDQDLDKVNKYVFSHI